MEHLTHLPGNEGCGPAKQCGLVGRGGARGAVRPDRGRHGDATCRPRGMPDREAYSAQSATAGQSTGAPAEKALVRPAQHGRPSRTFRPAPVARAVACSLPLGGEEAIDGS